MNRLYLWFDMAYSLFTDWRLRRRHRHRIHEDEENDR